MGWVAIDLDGTLAHYGRSDWDGISIGEPIPRMVERVKEFIRKGKEVRIMTARMSKTSLLCNKHTYAEVAAAIRAWCLEHIGKELPVTCEKDIYMEVLYDDRCVQVEFNTGRLTTDVIRNEAAAALFVTACDDDRPIGGFHDD